jgi:hypothetical protein
MLVNSFKKAFLFVLLYLSIQLNGVAQVYSNKESSIFSFTAGMTSSNLLKDSIHYKPGISFCGGFSYSVMLNDRLNAEIELLYTGKAFKKESPIIKYRYFFVDIPLMLQVNLSENIRMNIGVQYSIATNAQYVTLDTNSTSGIHTYKASPVKSADYGFLGGAEIDLSKSISLGARYTISGSTFFEKNGVNFGVFQLSIKYSPIKTYRVFFPKKEAQK